MMAQKYKQRVGLFIKQVSQFQIAICGRCMLKNLLYGLIRIFPMLRRNTRKTLQKQGSDSSPPRDQLPRRAREGPPEPLHRRAEQAEGRRLQ